MSYHQQATRRGVQNMLKLLIILVENISPRQRANYVIWTLLLNIWNLIFQNKIKSALDALPLGLYEGDLRRMIDFQIGKNWFTKAQNITKH